MGFTTDPTPKEDGMRSKLLSGSAMMASLTVWQPTIIAVSTIIASNIVARPALAGFQPPGTDHDPAIYTPQAYCDGTANHTVGAVYGSVSAAVAAGLVTAASTTDLVDGLAITAAAQNGGHVVVSGSAGQDCVINTTILLPKSATWLDGSGQTTLQWTLFNGNNWPTKNGIQVGPYNSVGTPATQVRISGFKTDGGWHPGNCGWQACGSGNPNTTVNLGYPLQVPTFGAFIYVGAQSDAEVDHNICEWWFGCVNAYSSNIANIHDNQFDNNWGNVIHWGVISSIGVPIYNNVIIIHHNYLFKNGLNNFCTNSCNSPSALTGTGTIATFNPSGSNSSNRVPAWAPSAPYTHLAIVSSAGTIYEQTVSAGCTSGTAGPGPSDGTCVWASPETLIGSQDGITVLGQYNYVDIEGNTVQGPIGDIFLTQTNGASQSYFSGPAIIQGNKIDASEIGCINIFGPHGPLQVTGNDCTNEESIVNNGGTVGNATGIAIWGAINDFNLSNNLISGGTFNPLGGVASHYAQDCIWLGPYLDGTSSGSPYDGTILENTCSDLSDPNEPSHYPVVRVNQGGSGNHDLVLARNTIRDDRGVGNTYSTVGIDVTNAGTNLDIFGNTPFLGTLNIANGVRGAPSDAAVTPGSTTLSTLQSFAGLPTASVPAGTVGVDSSGMRVCGAYNATGGWICSGEIVYLQSQQYVAAAAVGEQNLVSVPLPRLAANAEVRVTAYWGYTNNSDDKALLIRFSSSSGITGTALLNTVVTTTGYTQSQNILRNNNSQTAQVSYSSGQLQPYGSQESQTTNTVTTTGTTYLNFNCNLSKASDNVTLLGYSVEILEGSN